MDTADRARATPLAFFAARPVFSAVIGAGCIAFSAIFVRLSDASPATVAVFRTAYALPILGVLAWVERARFGPRTRRTHILAAVAGIAFAVDLVTWHHAIEAVGAGLATVLGNMQVVVVALVAWLFLKERPERKLFVAVPVMVVGVIFVSGVIGEGAYGENPALGVIYGVATSIAYTVFILVHRESARDLRRPAGPLFEASAVAALGALAYGLVAGNVDLAPSWPAHGWLVLLALTSQVLGWLLLSISLPRLPAALTSALLLLQPVGSLGLGAVILGEDPSAVQFIGVTLILAGVILAARRGARAPATEPLTP